MCASLENGVSSRVRVSVAPHFPLPFTGNPKLHHAPLKKKKKQKPPISLFMLHEKMINTVLFLAVEVVIAVAVAQL